MSRQTKAPPPPPPSTSTLGHPSITKYAKIQPAIAIKPKPIGVAPRVSHPFIPKYETATAQPPATSRSSEEALINTSRKWVLPPRPRPGRKPTSSGLGTLSPAPEKPATKKKYKTLKKLSVPSSDPAIDLVSDALNTPLQQSVYMTRLASSVDTTASVTSATSATALAEPSHLAASPSATTVPTQSVGRGANTELQMTYLARLKEQELIRSYIDVLSDQIKQLKFVQNGVITFDVLNDTASKPVKAPASVPELFDHIHNIHDLDKFLACLTAQLNVIHSVRKPGSGGSPIPPPASVNDGNESTSVFEATGSTVPSLDMPLLQQVKHYLELRANRLKRDRTMGSWPQLLLALTLPRALSASAEAPEKFTPSLLRPLRMNSFEPQQDVEVDIINTADTVINERSRIDDQMGEVAPGILNLLAQENEQKSTDDRKNKKFSCGFCSNGTPCLCYEAGI